MGRRSSANRLSCHPRGRAPTRPVPTRRRGHDVTNGAQCGHPVAGHGHGPGTGTGTGRFRGDVNDVAVEEGQVGRRPRCWGRRRRRRAECAHASCCSAGEGELEVLLFGSWVARGAVATSVSQISHMLSLLVIKMVCGSCGACAGRLVLHSLSSRVVSGTTNLADFRQRVSVPGRVSQRGLVSGTFDLGSVHPLPATWPSPPGTTRHASAISAATSSYPASEVDARGRRR